MVTLWRRSPASIFFTGVPLEGPDLDVALVEDPIAEVSEDLRVQPPSEGLLYGGDRPDHRGSDPDNCLVEERAIHGVVSWDWGAGGGRFIGRSRGWPCRAAP